MKNDSKMTIEDLAKLLTDRFDSKIEALEMHLTKTFDSKIEDLAAMTQRQFEQQDARINLMEKRLTDRIDDLAEDVGKIRYYIFNLDDRFVTTGRFEAFIEKDALLS